MPPNCILTHPHFICAHAQGLFAQRPFEPIAGVMLVMGIAHDAMGEMKEVLVLVSPRHIV